MDTTKRFLLTTRTIFRIYWQISPRLTLGILVTQVLMQLQGLANAYVLALVLDKLVSFVLKGSATTAEILPIVFVYSVIYLANSLTTNFYDYFSTLLSSYDTAQLKLKQTDFMELLGISQLEDPELTNRSTRYTEIYTSLSQQLSVLIGLIATIVGAFVSGAIVISFSPLLVLLFVGLFVFKYINNSRFRKGLFTLYRENTEERRKAWNSIGVLADPSSLKELTISGGAQFIRNKFTSWVDDYYKKYKKIRTNWAAFEFIQTLFDGILYALGIYIVVEKGLAGAISVGAITFYIRSMATFSGQIDGLSYRIGRAIESGIRVDDALELFELYKPIEDGSMTLPVSKNPPVIELVDVSFQYQNGPSPVIKNLSLKINPGEKIAIVGENGAGKTTLVKLLSRIYRPQKGDLTVNNIPLNKIRLKSWYQKLGVLFQDYNAYGHLTVAENVGIGRIKNKTFIRSKTIKALKKAEAFEFVNKYPKNIDQILSERYKGGIRPSGGQWQKIAIARFLYRDVPVLILDEPTASIDAVSEAKIFNNIYKFMKGKTVIIISHRFSTVRNADRILVLDKGSIIEDGNHEELMKLDGKYAHAFKLQAKGYA